MKHAFYGFLLFVGCLTQGIMAQGLQRLKLTPINLYNEGNFYPHWVDSITNSGNLIYTSTVQDTFILVLERDGKFVKTIGKSGGGPGEFAGGVVAMSVYKDHVLALATPKDRFSHFVSGEYVGFVKIKPVANTTLHTRTANTFAFFEDTAVFPAFPGTGYLGFAYDIEGRVTPVGELLYSKEDLQRLGKHPLINDTLWTYGDGSWYAIFRYENLILRYDKNFKMVGSFRPDNSRLSLIMEELQNYDPQKLKTPPTLFRDVKYRDGALYLMAAKTLIRVNAGTGVIEANYDFHAEGDGFEAISGNGLNFSTFTILDDGTLILGPAFVWDHFLMTTQLPDYPQKKIERSLK